MKVPRWRHTATLLADGTVLVAGGMNSGWPQAAERYNPATNKWSSAGTMSTGRADATATRLLDGRVLVAGGDNPGELASAELYDPATNRWTLTGSLSTARAGDAVRLADGRVLINGSWRGEVYSPATGTWTPTGDNVYRYGGALALLGDGRALEAGGGYLECDNEGGCWFIYVTNAEVYTP